MKICTIQKFPTIWYFLILVFVWLLFDVCFFGSLQTSTSHIIDEVLPNTQHSRLVTSYVSGCLVCRSFDQCCISTL